MRRTHHPRREQRGYVLMIVMILLVVLTAAGVYGMRTAQSDIRAGGLIRRAEIAGNAVEVGAAARMAEIMAASEDAGAALGNFSQVEGAWRVFNTAPQPANAFQRSVQDAQYIVSAQPTVAVEANPPAGIQIGTGGQLTLWRVDAFAIAGKGSTGQQDGQAQRLSVGVSVWSRGGLSYNSN